LILALKLVKLRSLRLGSMLVRREIVAIQNPNQKQYAAPPDVGMQVEQHHGIRRRVAQFVEPCSQNEKAIHQERNADKKPDRDGVTALHIASPEQKVKDQEGHRHDGGPEYRPFVNGHV